MEHAAALRNLTLLAGRDAWNSQGEMAPPYAALRKLKLLVGSGGLDFTKGMDSLNKNVEHISFHCIVTNLVDHNSMTKPSVSAHGTGFCFRSAMKGWA